MADVIPDEVKSFLLANIDTVAQLEALLLLRRLADQCLSCEDVAQRLYINPLDAAVLLSKLVSRGLILMEELQPAVFQYNYRNEQVVQEVNRLAEVYSKYLIPVTNFIHQKPLKSIQDFADAFKLKKDE